MRTGASYLRVIVFMVIAFYLLEFTIDSGDQLAIVKYPIIWAILATLLLFVIAIELISESLKSILYKGLSDEAKANYTKQQLLAKEKRFRWIKQRYQALLGSSPIESEDEIILDHNYDGIKELDNKLPPWWVYGFYVTIIFAIVYMVRYHVFNDVNQAQEYEIAVAEAQLEIDEYKRTAKDLVDVNSVELLTESIDLNAGKTIYELNCVACHKSDGGGGIGPNLTDEYWILGGGIKNVFKTVSEGGRAGQGMVPWKNDLKPLEIAQVSSYLLSFQGTSSAEPKEAQGELWIDPDAAVEPVVNKEVNSVLPDSTIVNDSEIQ